MTDTNIELMPYLQYPGDCEEALNFYKDILQGRMEIASRYDNPAMKAPEEYKNKILHASFYFGKHLIFASDTLSKKTHEPMQSNVALSLGFKDEREAENIFDKLSAGGKIHVPFKKQFWGDWHGNFTDRFGIRWMVNCTK
jgi:PhnB protein